MILDHLGGIVAWTVLIVALIAWFFTSESKIEYQRPERVLLSGGDADNFFLKAKKYSSITLFIFSIIGPFFLRDLVQISPHFGGIFFLTLMASFTLWRFSIFRIKGERIDLPRPFFQVLGLLLTVFFIIIFYWAGVELSIEALNC